MREGEIPMRHVNRPLGGHSHSTWVGLLAVLMLAALPVLAASTFSAPAAQSTIYLPLVQRPLYRIAFVSSYYDGVNWIPDIYVINADGTNVINLTKTDRKSVV